MWRASGLRTPCLFAGFVAAACIGTAAARDCRDLATQTDINQCAGDKFAQADKLLNEQYKSLSACNLAKSQRAWLAYRDAECLFQVGPRGEGGSLRPMANAACLEALTKERSLHLSYYLTCQEGDASCPTWHCRSK